MFVFLADDVGIVPHNPWKLFFTTSVRLRGREDRLFYYAILTVKNQMAK